MKIIKYRKGAKGLYKVELDDSRVLSLYEEVILKFELLLKKEIDSKDIPLQISKFPRSNVSKSVWFCIKLLQKDVTRENKTI